MDAAFALTGSGECDEIDMGADGPELPPSNKAGGILGDISMRAGSCCCCLQMEPQSSILPRRRASILLEWQPE